MSPETPFETLLLDEPLPGVMVVSFNRPKTANALNTRMAHDIHALFGQITVDPGDLRCLVLTGAGEKVFCAGADLKERHGMSEADWLRQHVVFEHAFYAIMDCPVPVIAAVNGAAYGGGCEFALCCDFIHASANARFALPEVSLGIIPGGGGTQTLSRAVGERRAREIIFSAAPFTPEEALTWGMVNAVHEPADLMPRVLALAARISANAPIAVRQSKRAIALGADAAIKTALATEIEAYNQTVGTADRTEGITAFNEKRPPAFRGR
jgi:enoyl-CoA hydratase